MLAVLFLMQTVKSTYIIEIDMRPKMLYHLGKIAPAKVK